MDHKLVASLDDVILTCGLRDGMTVDFNHCLRNGDYVVASVMHAIAKAGLRDIRIFASAIMDGMMEQGLTDLIRQGVISSVEVTGNSGILGRIISHGEFSKVCRFHTHGGRPRAVMDGDVHIDVSFIAAPTADPMGNCNGIEGPNAYGSMGFSMTSARYADKVVVITDHLVPYPLQRVSIDESLVDYVVKVDAIGTPNGIATGIAKPTRDPLALIIAEYASQTILHSGLLKDGFSYQAGAGGTSIAASNFVAEQMLQRKIHGSFLLGGITGTGIDMCRNGLFDTALDVQCFDQKAAASLQEDAWHREISDACYAAPGGKDGSRSACVDSLDAVVLGTLEVDLDFNCNLVVNSSGVISGGAGGHSDTAAGAKLSLITAPLRRTRFPTVVKRCTSITTPGKDISAVVTEYGVAVNPNQPELRQRLIHGGVKVVEIQQLQQLVEDMSGIPEAPKYGNRVVAEVVDRYGCIIDQIHCIAE